MDLKRLPHSPGVYLFKNNRGSVIYVGKAVDLRNRVSSYFSSGTRKAGGRTATDYFQKGRPQPNPRLLPRTSLLVRDIRDLDFIRVESEIEALILEANLIKKYRPYYNVRLKDDKDYLYIKVTKEDFPTVELARSRDLPGAKIYFGPFPESRAARTTYKLLRKLFPFRTCTHNQGKACFYYHIGLCLGVCIGAVDKKTYNLMIRRLIHFLQGKKEQTVRELAWDMNNAARRLEFERAGQLKRQIESIEYVTQRTTLIHRYMDNPNLVEDLRDQALAELAAAVNLPGRHLTRIEAYDNSNLQGSLGTSSMVVFTRGEPDPPQYRKFRIHRTHGADDFRKANARGFEKADDFRKANARGFEKADDYADMKEVFRRRFKRLKIDPTQRFNLTDRKFLDVNADESFEAVPDLIVVDGGKGQLSAAAAVLTELNLPIPIISLAKRLEEIYLPGNSQPIRLPRSSEALKLVQHLRDEAHRFAITYHRKLRSKALIPTEIIDNKIVR